MDPDKVGYKLNAQLAQPGGQPFEHGLHDEPQHNI